MELHERSHSVSAVVRVNGEELNYAVQQASGEEIKRHALRHGMEIREDFELFELSGDGQKKRIADEELVDLRNQRSFTAEPPIVEVHVNEIPVRFHRHRATGLEVKETSIEQGVPIRKDFNLFELHDSHAKPVPDAELIELNNRTRFRASAPELNIFVNKKPVVLHVHHANGAEIKQAAISQGVNIQPDFNLFKIKEDGGLAPVNDNEVIKLHEGEKFSATAPDDSSNGLLS
jgi:hypothetical protein